MSSSPPPPPPPTLPQQQSSSGLSFAQGFLLGQLSIAIIIFVFIKFFIFGESPSSSDYHLRHHGRSSRAVSFGASTGRYLTASPKPRLASPLRRTNPLTTSAILAKTYYNVRNHQPESVDWFNVLIAQTIAQLRNDAQQDNAILASLTDLMNGDRKPDYIDEIKVTELSLGEEFPIFSNCRVIPVDNTHPPPSAGRDGAPRSRPSSSAGDGGGDAGGRLQARMDVDLSDAITLGIETKLLLNFPRPLVAVMPVSLAVSVVRFSGTLSISFIPSPSPLVPPPSPPTSAATTSDTPSPPPPPAKSPPTTLTFSFDPSYRLELSTHSLLGSRARLQDIPKIAQLVESRLHAWFDERCVEPRFQRVVLPSLWPRRGNVGTRGEAAFDGAATGHRDDEAAVYADDDDDDEDDDGGDDAVLAKEEQRRREADQHQRAMLEARRERQHAEGLRWRKERQRQADEDERGGAAAAAAAPAAAPSTMMPPPSRPFASADGFGLPGSMPGTLPL